MTQPSLEPLRFSQLKFMGKSPAHYRWFLGHPMKQTRAMLIGEALDAVMFKSKTVMTFEGTSRRGKAWDNFAEANPEAVKLLAPERAQVDGMAESLQANSAAMELLEGKCQQTLNWKVGPRECRGTPDVFRKTRVVELKTTRNANPFKFQSDGRFMGYHAQLTWYADGLVELGLVNRNPECVIVAVESSPPYPVVIFALTDRAIIEGTKIWNLWFNRLMVCEQTGLWPGYSDAIVPFETPDTEGLTLRIEGEEVDIE